MQQEETRRNPETLNLLYDSFRLSTHVWQPCPLWSGPLVLLLKRCWQTGQSRETSCYSHRVFRSIPGWLIPLIVQHHPRPDRVQGLGGRRSMSGWVSQSPPHPQCTWSTHNPMQMMHESMQVKDQKVSFKSKNYSSWTQVWWVQACVEVV